MKVIKVLDRDRDVVKLEELDLLHMNRKSAACYTGMIAVMMLNVALAWFAGGEINVGVLHLVFAAIIGATCVHHVIWARRSKECIKYVEEELKKKKEERNNAENT
ncbi:MAG: hypothetical protein IKM48_08600 [Clostridia bacterium]|nr:hypothetical protein [Clostridia bacterium]